MATFYSTGVGGNYPERMTLRTVATINSQDPVTNKSNVTISAYAYYNYNQYTAPNPTEGDQSLRIDDVRVFSSSKNLDYTGTSSSNQRLLFSWTGDIEHDPDGTKTVQLKVWQDCPNVTTLDYLSGTHNWTLTPIARASVPSISPTSAAIGTAVTISTNRTNPGFTHTLEYALGSQKGTIATGVTDSASWTLPLSLANALPNSTSGLITITCKTYNGATLIGTKTTTMTATVPNSATFRPGATLTAIAEATAAMAGVGTFLAGLSRLRVLSNASAKYGASVTQLKIEAGGAVYYGADITTAVINSTGPVPVKLTVTDSRGYTATDTVNLTFAAVIAPTLSAGSVALGGQVTITTNRAATTLTHTLKYALGSQAGTIATGVGASHLWNPVPLSIANALPNAISGTVTITQETYNGANLLTTKTVTIGVTVPDNATFKPGAAITSIGEGASGLTAFTVRIQGKSKLLIATSATPKYGATIEQIKVEVDGGTYYGSFTAGAGAKTANITTAIIPTAGAVTALLTVTDNRGYTNTHSLGTTVEPYAPPRINSFTASRSPTDQGEDLSAPLDFTISPIANQNTKHYTLRHRPTGGTWTTLVDSTAAYTLSTTHTAAGALDADLSYEVELAVSDYFGSAVKTIPIRTAFDLINFNASGKGVAFGKVSERDALEVAMPLWYYGKEAHLITESGSSTSGRWIKFSDGTMICFGAINVTIPEQQLLGGFVWGTTGTQAEADPVTFPQPFVGAAPMLSLAMEIGEELNTAIRTVSSTAFTWRLYTYSQVTTGSDKKLMYTAIGRWKA